MEPLKNLFSRELVVGIADHLERTYDAFDRPQFEEPVLAELESLELKARAQLVADHIHEALPEDVQQRQRILRDMLHPLEDYDADSATNSEGIRGWAVMPMSMVVGQHMTSDFDGSMDLLVDMTKRFTSEFAVRYFLLEDQDKALDIMTPWVDDESQHVRRLVSEGSRPRLPWAMALPKLIDDPSPVLPLLVALRDDDEEYVRRSVANHLNDIAKDHPDLVAALAVDWMNDADKNRERLVRHACRSLIKAGHPVALEAFGILPPDIVLDRLSIETETVIFGASLEFSAEIRSTSTKDQALVVDYLVHFMKANGKLVSKVFKWKTLNLKPGDTRSLTRSHAIRPISTRRYYDGEQALSLRINGDDFGYVRFDLEGAESFKT